MAQATMPAQSAANHARMVPGFHYVGGLLVGGNLIWSIMTMIRYHGGRVPEHNLLVAVILVILFWYCRSFPLKVQDRVIRLEERLRLARTLPADMHQHIDNFTPQQLIAMRFASDEELAQLARRVLAENIEDSKAIKAAIQNWRADHLRA